MKNVDKLYEKYYNAYKSDYDTDDELKEDKKTDLDCKQFKLNNKISKESKVIELPEWLSSRNDFNEARKLINNLRADTNKVKSSSGDEKVVNDLNGLINDIQNKKTTRKSAIKKIKNIISDLDQLRQKKITVFQNKMIDVAYYLFNALGISTKPARLMLPKWIKVSEERFNEILSTVTEAKNKGLKTNVNGSETRLDNAEILLKSVGSGKIDKHEFKKKYSNIVDYVEKILNRSMLTRNQNKMVEILLLLKELVEGPPYEQPDTTDMAELESEESTEQRGQALKILTPNQMLSRLPIYLAQLKAGNNSEKLKNKIRQLLYSLYRSKKLTKNIYRSLVDVI